MLGMPCQVCRSDGRPGDAVLAEQALQLYVLLLKRAILGPKWVIVQSLCGIFLILGFPGIDVLFAGQPGRRGSVSRRHVDL